MRSRLFSGLSLLTMTFSIFVSSCAAVPASSNNITPESENSTDVQKSKGKSPQSEDPKYAQMSEEEKLRFIADKSNEFLGLFPERNKINGDGAKPYIDGDGLKAVKQHVDSYLKRTVPAASTPAGCGFRDSLANILKRGEMYATDLGSAFVNKGLPAPLGIYIPMIEAEFCPCLQAPTGPLGMFQFTATTGADFGLKTNKEASTQDPDDRCNPKLSADAAASWFKKMLDADFGNDAIGSPFAISAYNSGVGNMKKLIRLKNTAKVADFTYWTLRKSVLSSPRSDAANKLAIEQFVVEGSKYFPKFLAAFIIGENPKVFGIEMEPLSK
jgi:hypothetical protein